ncbi:MAG TPA: hypothetical protein PKD09_12740 [Aggregatilinea sp.]|uniref:hypothetical protein n=1 Tax=Aggregatilinea sp. TaxID=2806333 RepID=UPI002BCA08D5|nr:hypothetical protein [Aggregatilinea sp.]HML22512.1 hypothetical protein [Aggregatilinea sp.]
MNSSKLAQHLQFQLYSNWTVLVAIGWSALSIVWACLILPGNDAYPPELSLGLGETFDYMDVISRHQMKYLNLSGPVVSSFIFFIFIISTIGLFFSSKQKRLIILFSLPGNALLFIVFLVSMVPWHDYTVLKQLDALDFENHSYKLTLAYGKTSGLDVSYEHLLVFECSSDEKCYMVELVPIVDLEYPYQFVHPEKAQLVADSELKQVQVYVEGNLSFTVGTSK